MKDLNKNIPNVTLEHSIFQQWKTNELINNETFIFSNELQLIVHQDLFPMSELTNYVGTILDLKVRHGQTQKIYRLKNENNKAMVYIYDSEDIFNTQIVKVNSNIQSVFVLTIFLLENIVD